MGNTQPLIRHVSDTALLTAMFRALETERADAAFRDPLARQLAGERGARIFEAMPPEELRNAWAWTTRAYLFDQFVIGAVRDGLDTVVTLAAGLDTRPYRMELPPALRWIEVDLPDLLAYKENRLKGERPRCALERIRLDLTDRDARREWIDRLGHTTRDVLVLTEGLLIYLD